MLYRLACAGVALALIASLAWCQQTPPTGNDDPPPSESKRILGIIPNYRSYPSQRYEPLTSAEKFTIASEDALDRGTFALAAAFAGQAELTNANRSFGQGSLGFARYFGTAYGDFLIGDYMTEAVFPTLLHQDPRYFRRGTGSGWSRLAYSMGRIFWISEDRPTGYLSWACSQA